ncbi:Uncharacterised protein [Mycobacteroides abscessus subsp. bolletii]|nr:Uncharacterised protein [Mycobacteroides abscessus]SKF61968.1 Uncharacterised protein [Mycobacteroides abscessus subsp. bolletii]SKH89645.1 Uncharacterised protein [Mycobacteroides abscessus subsp. bolletii]
MQLCGNAVSEPFVIVESAAVEHTAVYPYLHAGEDNDLWQVSITVNTRLRAADACAASEAAHQLITVDPAWARTDAFEFEITVFSGDKAQPKLAS